MSALLVLAAPLETGLNPLWPSGAEVLAVMAVVGLLLVAALVAVVLVALRASRSSAETARREQAQATWSERLDRPIQ